MGSISASDVGPAVPTFISLLPACPADKWLQGLGAAGTSWFTGLQGKAAVCG